MMVDTNQTQISGFKSIRIRTPEGLKKVTIDNKNIYNLYEQMKDIINISDQLYFFDNNLGKPDMSKQLNFDNFSILQNGMLLHLLDSKNINQTNKYVYNIDLEQYKHKKEKDEEEKLKIRNSLYGNAKNWGNNVITFRKTLKMKHIKEQKNRIVVQAQITSAMVKTLINDVTQDNFEKQHLAFIYGTMKNRKENTTILKWKDLQLREETVKTMKMRMETYWKPPQYSENGYVYIKDDENSKKEIEKIEKIIKLLDLQCIGMIITIPLNKQDEYKLRTHELLLSTKYQSIYGSGFTTLILPVGIDEKGNSLSCCEAWQSTESLLELYKQNDIEEKQEDDNKISFKEHLFVYKNNQETETTSIEVEMFQKKIPVILHRTRFMGPSVFYGKIDNIKKYMDVFDYKPMIKRLSDLNLLYELTNIFDLETDFPVLCDEIKNEKDLSDGFLFLINSFINM